MTTLSLNAVPLGETWSMHGTGAGWMSAMMIGAVLFWSAVILGIVWLIRDGLALRRRTVEESALTILDRRFVEGAVSADDYQLRRDVLTGVADPRPDPDPVDTEES